MMFISGRPPWCSPRTWRWSAPSPHRRTPSWVLSTHVEVVRPRPYDLGLWRGALHARGGGPLFVPTGGPTGSCSPRTWRWSVGITDQAPQPPVLSTHVEVVRSLGKPECLGKGALHARGGGPGRPGWEGRLAWCSPRTWRWSGCAGPRDLRGSVLSTHVEVVRRGWRRSPRGSSALHARGGGPGPGWGSGRERLYSPRTWRWSAIGHGLSFSWGVLSTHVEVVRQQGRHGQGLHGALHARGGGPHLARERHSSSQCSPRTWRWSVASCVHAACARVLSTHVEVVRPRGQRSGGFWCALHARGGGPPPGATLRGLLVCSPRTWRWSESFVVLVRCLVVLSTHVEVVRSCRRRCGTCRCALHARGGGPRSSSAGSPGSTCSPRTWRWSDVVGG